MAQVGNLLMKKSPSENHMQSISEEQSTRKNMHLKKGSLPDFKNGHAAQELLNSARVTSSQANNTKNGGVSGDTDRKSFSLFNKEDPGQE